MTQYHHETVFTWGATPMKFGAGALDEIGFDLGQFGADRVLIVTDPGVNALGIPERIREAAAREGIDAHVYDQVHIEPTDRSLLEAVEYAKDGRWDAFVAVGGGSAIDTAKAVNLLTCYPADLFDYINKPIGKGLAPPGPLKPLIAVPTTAGTGAETTPACIADLLDQKVKSGISHARLRPNLAVIDPLVTLTMPPAVTAASGFDVLCHALESYTARSFSSQPRHTPESRVPYCGANPISDVWCERALTLLGRSFRRAYLNGDDLEARTDMMLAATFAGMGFGNAGVHLPHACSYPIAGRVRDYVPADYPPDEPLVPHGQSVCVTAPAAFRFTYATAPERHRRAADLLDPHGASRVEPGERLPSVLVDLMRDLDVPNGTAALGYTEADTPELVSGALRQHRLLRGSPRTADAAALENIFRASLRNW
ncbi:iron-containing alcohol dehydrogenase [Spiractinospora alimapuensis]|uniref:hydroxyacid-oxoacid transhydrogenase n=1 Tax=Spiractinospora alimapuensis TaxID=2820884 RepID=UPI001F20E40A|nr:hydroxyacid-oxoacid transhydrogenase [Spiractinospora alimapuensis]QVQ52377.1 iron-containing alcohol dehydrogenase [Spiractinospora alimapuensis]